MSNAPTPPARPASLPAGAAHQTTRLGRGRHARPDDGMCAMELASVLAGERFTDRPSCVCPVLSAFLRGYNDGLPDDVRHATLAAWASQVVGSRSGDPATEHERAARIAAFTKQRLPLHRRLGAPFTDEHLYRCEVLGGRVGRWAGADGARRGAVDGLLEQLCALGAPDAPARPSQAPTKASRRRPAPSPAPLAPHACAAEA